MPDISDIPRFHSLNGLFPEKVIVDDIFTQEEHFYVKEKRAYWDIDFDVDTENEVIGNTHCSLCGATVDLFDKYCHRCGARTFGRRYGSEFSESF